MSCRIGLVFFYLCGSLLGWAPFAVHMARASEITQQNGTFLKQVERPYVVLITPRNDAFWTLFATITQAAADDLNIELEWLPALNDSQKQLKDALAVLDRPHPPDALIYKNFDGTAVPILQAAEAKKVYSILFEEALTPEETAKYGVPREHFKYYLGELLPDNLEAGHALLKALVQLAKAQQRYDSQGRIQLLALGGNMNEASSSERIKGLQIALQNEPDVLLHEIGAAYWQEPAAYHLMRRLLPAYPQTQIIWTANDTMPVGAYRAAQEAGMQPLIGGMGSTPPAALDVWQERVDVSVGGHFLQGAFVLVLLRDFFSGHDFAAESTLMRLSLFTFTRENVQNYAQALADNDWGKVRFDAFSRAYSPGLSKYQFGFLPILEQLAQQPQRPSK